MTKRFTAASATRAVVTDHCRVVIRCTQPPRAQYLPGAMAARVDPPAQSGRLFLLAQTVPLTLVLDNCGGTGRTLDAAFPVEPRPPSGVTMTARPFASVFVATLAGAARRAAATRHGSDTRRPGADHGERLPLEGHAVGWSCSRRWASPTCGSAVRGRARNRWSPTAVRTRAPAMP